MLRESQENVAYCLNILINVCWSPPLLVYRLSEYPQQETKVIRTHTHKIYNRKNGTKICDRGSALCIGCWVFS